METRHYLTCLWPGLPELWWRGRLSALPPAIAFGLGLNLLLVMRFLYPEWMSGVLVRFACWVAIGSWIFYVIRSVRDLPLIIAPRTVSEEADRFTDAQWCYLRAEYADAEKLLLGVLAIEPRDPPAILLLSGVYRHTQRLDQSQLLLDELERLEAADSWSLEVQAEKQRLQRHQQTAKSDEESNEEAEKTAAEMTAA